MRFDFEPEPQPSRQVKAFLVFIMLAIAFSPALLVIGLILING